MCRLYVKVCALFRTRLIFPRINGPNVVWPRVKQVLWTQNLLSFKIPENGQQKRATCFSPSIAAKRVE